MMFRKCRISDWLPPVLAHALRNLRRKHIRFVASSSIWDETAAQCTGYDSTRILAKVLDATLRVKRGEAAFERDSVLFMEPELNWPVATGLLLAAANRGGRLNVLDFGGALGSMYFRSRTLLRHINDVRWSIVEQPHYVCAAKEHGLEENRLHFYDSIGACAADAQIDLVLLSSVLQYIPDPALIINEIIRLGARWLIVDRTPFQNHSDDRLFIQRVPKAIYHASYPMWALSEPKFRARLEQHFREFAVFDSREDSTTAVGCPFTFKGMIWEAKA